MQHILKRGLLRLPYWSRRRNGAMFHFAQCTPFTFKYSTKEDSENQVKPQEDPATTHEENKPEEGKPEMDNNNATDNDDNSLNYPLLGGGLQKQQGGMLEETFFNDRQKEMIEKIKKEGHKKRDDYESEENWNEYKKTLETTDYRDGSSANKHKNAIEEVYFLNEQLDMLRALSDRMRELSSETRPIFNEGENSTKPITGEAEHTEDASIDLQQRFTARKDQD